MKQPRSFFYFICHLTAGEKVFKKNKRNEFKNAHIKHTSIDKVTDNKPDYKFKIFKRYLESSCCMERKLNILYN